MFDCIYINGDSFSASNKEHLVYGDYLSEKLSIPVVNQAVIGTNNDRITRSTIEHIGDLKQYRNPLIIVGWSYIRRQEVWYYGEDEHIIKKYVPDQDNKLHIDDIKQPRLLTLEWLIKTGKIREQEKYYIKDYNEVHKELVDFYTNLYMFAHTLQFHGLSYFIFSAAKNTDCGVENFPYINSLSHVDWCKHNPKIWRLHDFSIPEWAEKNDPNCDPVTKHLSQEGHRKFADLIWDNIQLAYKGTNHGNT